MSDSPTTSDNKCEILGDFWISYKSDPRFEDFISYNDLGLPLAYAISSGIVSRTELSDSFINETFELLLDAFGVGDDTGFDALEDILPMG